MISEFDMCSETSMAFAMQMVSDTDFPLDRIILNHQSDISFLFVDFSNIVIVKASMNGISEFDSVTDI